MKPVGNSDFDLGSRVVGMVSYQKEYISHLKTSLSIFYNGQSGRRISYIYDDYNGYFTNEAYRGPELLYVPKDHNDINFGYYDATKACCCYDRTVVNSRKCIMNSMGLLMEMII